MTKRIEIDTLTGQWAEVKDVADLNAGDRRAVKAAYGLKLNGDNELTVPGDYAELTKNAMAARVIVNWSLPHPLPSGDPAVLDKLSLKQLDAIYKGIAEHIDALNEAEQLARQGKESLPTGGSAS